jgi:catechol 2,3-dioxygenase
MPSRLISQLAHVELLTPTADASLAFFRDMLGLQESGRSGQSVFLRGWGEWFQHSVQLTEASHAGLGHIGWRAAGPAELEQAAAALDRAGAGEGWTGGDFGHGAAFRFRSPDGHRNELFWEVDWYAAPPERQSLLPNRPERHEPRGCAVRRLDHVTVYASAFEQTRDWYCQQLDFQFMEGIALDEQPDVHVFAAISTNATSHDLGVVRDASGASARLNHVAFFLDTPQDLLNAGVVLREAAQIETGPGRHGIGEEYFLYVLEPGGNRIELFTGGYVQYAPDWGPIIWRTSQRPDSLYQGFFAQSLTAYGTPAPELAGGVSAGPTTTAAPSPWDTDAAPAGAHP